MSMNRGLRFKFALLCQFHSKQNRAWFGKPSVINDNISDFKIRFLLLLIMKLSLLLLSFCHHNPQSSWWLSFFCVKWLFLCFVYYFLLEEMMMMTTTTYFVVGLLCCQLSLLLNELNFPAKNDLFVTQCQMSQVLKQPKKMLKWHMS